ncbi:4Fe-4S dicluster-binding protein [Glycomyces xiaoerkulensis]|uniref:4Fe-4S dicluster-binding protein n=1 Tax=Glycomyces xiaoerkulensis TaxID=2038139 RepID=UPI000C258DF2|nr:4Fe-4S dicluster-binding protein [Glycomyces xiaoerkulensis]
MSRPSLSDRKTRIELRTRDPRWKAPPRFIAANECIHCNSCVRACPESFDAIANVSHDVVIVPELCSGCPKCVDACPVDCIYPAADWEPTVQDRVWKEVARDDED